MAPAPLTHAFRESRDSRKHCWTTGRKLENLENSEDRRGAEGGTSMHYPPAPMVFLTPQNYTEITVYLSKSVLPVVICFFSGSQKN